MDVMRTLSLFKTVKNAFGLTRTFPRSFHGCTMANLKKDQEDNNFSESPELFVFRDSVLNNFSYHFMI